MVIEVYGLTFDLIVELKAHGFNVNTLSFIPTI